MLGISIDVFSIAAPNARNLPDLRDRQKNGFSTFLKKKSASVAAFLPSSFISAGKCVVLSFKDFLSCRPTEISENDVFLCESRYNESDKQMKKFKGLKRFSLSAKVVDDEIYYFR